MSDKADQHTESVDDEFRSMLEGLRTTLPGVQVLFAFLLSLPLLSEFGRLTAPEQWAHGVAFFGSAVASVLLIAPSVHQRIRAPFSGIQRLHESHVQTAVRLAIAGTVAFAAALVASVYLISSLVLPTTIATLASTVVVASLMLWSWFYVPLIRFRR